MSIQKSLHKTRQKQSILNRKNLWKQSIFRRKNLWKQSIFRRKKPVEAEYIQPEEPVEAEYIQPEESVEAEYIQPEKEADMSMPDTEGLETPGEEVSNDRDMTIGELYEIHEELNELEKNVQAGESIEEIKKELEKTEKRTQARKFFRRRDSQSKDGKRSFTKRK